MQRPEFKVLGAFRYKGEIINTIVDNLTSSGYYRLSDSSLTAKGYPFNYGCILVFACENYNFQIALSHKDAGNKIYYRFASSGSWGNWREI